MVDYGPKAPIDTTKHSSRAQRALLLWLVVFIGDARCCLLVLMRCSVVTYEGAPGTANVRRVTAAAELAASAASVHRIHSSRTRDTCIGRCNRMNGNGKRGYTPWPEDNKRHNPGNDCHLLSPPPRNVKESKDCSSAETAPAQRPIQGMYASAVE